MPVVMGKKKGRLYVTTCPNCKNNVGFSKNELVEDKYTNRFSDGQGSITCPSCGSRVTIYNNYETELPTVRLKKDRD
jgi:hypothetical protein